MAKVPSVEAWLDAREHWKAELTRLCDIVRQSDLEETVKWSMPCYTSYGRNIVALAGFKSYFGLWFFDGDQLSDPAAKLTNAQDGKTQHMRQWRMHSEVDINDRLVADYIAEAVGIARP